MGDRITPPASHEFYFGSNNMTNTCTRCGSTRVLAKTWEEVVELYSRKTTITHSQFVCPDPKCQKQVEDQLTQIREKREYAEHQKEIAKAEKLKENAKAAAARLL
ncbi:MAG: hypothetical protein A3F61_01645 [Candidatus Blackburnbacteria bacterium RIFCSPHIGHO2_12_FULL_41_13b]|uniref:Uncharacterized protein n=1 Tax=Candidatus Blackburnbacteria bacterium RIFCSPHIGHO2_12_FULL_41_13b TaxID=1797517 RepID=A0A1G1VCP7_9BACT|nr:MAG: hypothetical protein A3F61_01645 [Candidatus Blackburnbacteria bacterium RIFCSPHIGHO2_12_FULL_41_13b]